MRVAPALDQARRLEPVDQLDDDRRAHLQAVGELALGREVPSAEPRQGAELADLDAERPQLLVGALVEAVVGAGEQEPGAVGERAAAAGSISARSSSFSRACSVSESASVSSASARAIRGSISVIDSRPARRGMEGVGAPVVRVADALDEAARLEAVDQLDHRACG